MYYVEVGVEFGVEYGRASLKPPDFTGFFETVSGSTPIFCICKMLTEALIRKGFRLFFVSENTGSSRVE
jgi:hypothetical protein